MIRYTVQYALGYYCVYVCAELRQRQEMMMMMRNPIALNPQVLAQTQQRLQLEPRFIDRCVWGWEVD